MQDQKSPGPTAIGVKPSGWLTVENTRNLVFIVAALAVTYAALTFNQKPATPPVSIPVAPVPAVAPPAADLAAKAAEQAAPAPEAEVNPVAPAAPSGSIESSGRLDINSDDHSAVFKQFLQGKIDELNKAGPVVLTPQEHAAEPPQAAATPEQKPVAQAASQPTAVPQGVIETASSTAPVKGSSSTGYPKTTHPAPFVDKAAQASMESKRAAFIKTGKPGVAKIGYNVDGSLLTVAEREEQVRSTLTNIPDEWTLIYKAPQEKIRLYVFTDPTCPYCKKLHRAIPELQQAGISVHYLMYPRDMGSAAPDEVSPTAQNMRNIWCSVDQQAAMDSAFLGYRVAEANCDALPKSLHRPPAPVPDHYYMGQMFNVEGTPTMFASNGRSKTGFGDVNKLINILLH